MKLKLVTEKDNVLLGVVEFPDSWYNRNSSNIIEFFLKNEYRFLPWGAQHVMLTAAASTANVLLKKGAFIHSGYYTNDRYFIYGVTIEEFEALSDCFFYPGINYIREQLKVDKDGEQQ